MPITKYPLCLYTLSTLYSLSLQALCSPDCYSCDDLTGECTECVYLRRVDFYYGLFRNICYRLSDGCKDGHYTVSTGMLTHTCTECKYRYCLDTLTHTCSECLSSSPSCQITNCIRCDDRICAWCKVGWVKSDGQCYLDGELPPMCVDMIGDRCNECEYEYSDTGMKTRGYYVDITGQCQPCLAHCEECTDNTTCTRCISRYLLQGGYLLTLSIGLSALLFPGHV